jgi:ATP-dependent Lhr-like helicase
VFQGYPGQGQSSRQLQASSGLLYDVFAEYDPGNPLLAQGTREVLVRQLEAPRLAAALSRLRGSKARLVRPPRPTPFAFPLMVESFREKLTTEALEARVARMVEALERAASEPLAAPSHRREADLLG